MNLEYHRPIRKDNAMHRFLSKGLPTSLILTLLSLAFEMAPAQPLAAAEASDWPHWSGPNLDLTSPGGDVFAGEFRLERLWSTPLGSGYSGVAVVDERVVAAFSDGTSDFFAAFDAATGDELWRHRIAETYEGHDQNEDGPRSTPTIHDGVVYGLGPWGDLVALRLADGQKIWSRHVVEDLGAKRPFAGFATAPTVIGGVLVVQTGGPDGHSISGLDPATGEVSWSAEDDFVMYQSPVAVHVDGEGLVFAVTNERLVGLRPRNGEVLWQLPHELSEDQYHGISQPVLVDSAKVLVNGMTETALFRVARTEDGYQVSEDWRSRALGRGYSPSVPYEGYIYGYGGRFLTCVDARSGEIVWRSRPPGDGNLILVDGHLVILLRTGEVVVAEATPAGFREKTRARGLEYGFLTRPSFAAGRIFVRNLRHLASVGVSAAETAAALDEPELLGTLGELVRTLRTAEDKDRLIEEFMAAQRELPIIEGDLVHFVYRGEVEELGIGGSLFPAEMPMHRVEGTDFYFRSVSVEPGARFEYYYSVFGEIRPDPFNPRKSSVWGPEISVVTSRGWQEPAHLREPGGPRGRIEQLTWESEILDYGREVQVYLPPGYDEAKARYGLLVVHTGDQALTHGLMDRTLDNLIGKTVAPLVVAFVPQVQFEEGNSGIAEYSRALAEELIPLLEESYRTIGRPEARGVMGAGDGAVISLYAAFERPGLFGKVATQSLFMLDLKDDVPVLIENSARQDLDLYVEWSRLDFKDEPRRDARAESQEIVKALEEKGHRPVTLEVADGTGWGGWRLRTDRILETLFPLERTP
jgi:enterochelin esterase-like enzyme/outer membrane protein assembly factor BamB